MVVMISLDADLVGGWFARVHDVEQPVMSRWGIVPTAEEGSALAAGQARVAAAVRDFEPVADAHDSPVGAGQELWTSDPGLNVGLVEVPARMVLRYLTAMAAGIAGTRQAFAVSFGGHGLDNGPDDNMDGLSAVDVGAMALAAGLNAGAAALHGEISSPARRRGVYGRGTEPTAAESARQAGVAAAELVVDGAGLHQIAETAAGVAMNGWQVGLPDDPIDRIEYRARGLVGLLLVALELQTRDPEPIAEPASCGALPGENLGRAFEAEITFSMGLAATQIRELTVDLAHINADVVVWPGGQWPRFHLHTDRAGEAVGLLYAYGTPFDLEITDAG